MPRAYAPPGTHRVAWPIGLPAAANEENTAVTRYEKLCALYADARLRAETHRDRCAAVLERLRERLVATLGMPPDALAFRAVESESGPEPGEGQPVRDAMSSAEDGTWHVGAQVTLRDAKAPDQPFSLFFDLRVREDGGRFLVSLSEEDPGRTVRADDDAGLDAVAEDAARRLEAWLSDNLEQVLGASGRTERFGVYL